MDVLQTTEGGKLQVIQESSRTGDASLDASRPTDAPLSPDILAAQQSLSFLQGLSDLDSGLLSPGEETERGASCVGGADTVKSPENKSLLDDSPPSKMSSLPDLLDSFGPFGNDGLKNTSSSLSPALDFTVSVSNPFVQPIAPTIPPPLPPKHSVPKPAVVTGVGPGPSVNDSSCNPRQSHTPPQSSYSGFTIQGGRIPSIPCDTGHSFSLPPDPLSPPLEGPQLPLPPPLIPTSGADGSAAASSEGSTPRSSERQLKKEDTIDKVCNVLGDFVQTFDNLL